MGQDIRIDDASVPGAEETVSLHIEDGTVVDIGDTDAGAETVIDAAGGLVLPGFVDPHTHLDKAMVLDDLDGAPGSLDDAIALMQDRKERYTRDDVQDRAEQAIRLHLDHGCSTIRTHVDIDRICGLTALEGVVAARDTYDGAADIEIVAFPQEGLLTPDGSEDLMREAMRNGADVVGGMPAQEDTAEAAGTHIDTVLDIAERHDAPVDMHIDETLDPGSRTLSMLADRTRDRGLDDGRVTASHACALSSYPDEDAQQVIEAVAAADINVVTNPATNLLLQGRGAYPRPRGLTRVDQLRDADITVAAGQDNMQDGFYPYGQGNMLEVAWLLSHAAHMDGRSQQQAVLSMVTDDAAAVLGRDARGLAEGAAATLNVFPPRVTSVAAALRSAARPRNRIHTGELSDTPAHF